MVRIRDGEIVEDDVDNRQSSSQQSNDIRQRQFVPETTSGNTGMPTNATQPNAASGPSLFDAANNWLLNAGVPRIPIGSAVVIEPVAAVGVMLALVVFGLPGLLVVALMFLIRQLSRPDSQWGTRIGNAIGLDTSRPSTPNTTYQQRTRVDAPRTNQFKGSGYRLGS